MEGNFDWLLKALAALESPNKTLRDEAESTLK